MSTRFCETPFGALQKMALKNVEAHWAEVLDAEITLNVFGIIALFTVVNCQTPTRQLYIGPLLYGAILQSYISKQDRPYVRTAVHTQSCSWLQTTDGVSNLNARKTFLLRQMCSCWSPPYMLLRRVRSHSGLDQIPDLLMINSDQFCMCGWMGKRKSWKMHIDCPD